MRRKGAARAASNAWSADLQCDQPPPVAIPLDAPGDGVYASRSRERCEHLRRPDITGLAMLIPARGCSGVYGTNPHPAHGRASLAYCTGMGDDSLDERRSHQRAQLCHRPAPVDDLDDLAQRCLGEHRSGLWGDGLVGMPGGTRQRVWRATMPRARSWCRTQRRRQAVQWLRRGFVVDDRRRPALPRGVLP